MVSKEIVKENSISYPQRFKMDLFEDPFPWFLLSILFGARISESIAVRTFFLFKSENVLTPEAIIESGFDGLVAILDAGGYTRYDFRTANKLLEMSENLINAGGLEKVHGEAVDFEDLVSRLKNLAKGIGDITIGIFMREMVGVWAKARAFPSPLVIEAAKYLGIDPYSFHKRIGVNYGQLESFLVKVGKQCVRRKGSDNIFCQKIRQ